MYSDATYKQFIIFNMIVLWDFLLPHQGNLMTATDPYGTERENQVLFVFSMMSTWVRHWNMVMFVLAYQSQLFTTFSTPIKMLLWMTAVFSLSMK